MAVRPRYSASADSFKPTPIMYQLILLRLGYTASADSFKPLLSCISWLLPDKALLHLSTLLSPYYHVSADSSQAWLSCTCWLFWAHTIMYQLTPARLGYPASADSCMPLILPISPGYSASAKSFVRFLQWIRWLLQDRDYPAEAD